uniref:Uncharacterized protein n=1 Tax=Pristionchus pacificus TaxID=54126 RepID=A0A454Y7G0_PRIPA|eukprot:PDM64570.1 hypothetical protein PRIPAC_52826 [Pristionchus pacificus]
MPSSLSSTTTRATPKNYVNLTKTHIAKNLEEHDQAFLGDASLNAYGDVTYITVMGLNEPVQSVNYMLGLSWVEEKFISAFELHKVKLAENY